MVRKILDNYPYQSLNNVDCFPAFKSLLWAIDIGDQPDVERYKIKGVDLLTAVNEEANVGVLYKDHIGKQNYFQTPETTINLGTGNCEDHAVLKWWNLLGNNIPEEDMYFYSGAHKDYKIEHTILAVWLGRFYYLDNTTANLDTLTILPNASWQMNRAGVIIYD